MTVREQVARIQEDNPVTENIASNGANFARRIHSPHGITHCWDGAAIIPLNQTAALFSQQNITMTYMSDAHGNARCKARSNVSKTMIEEQQRTADNTSINGWAKSPSPWKKARCGKVRERSLLICFKLDIAGWLDIPGAV